MSRLQLHERFSDRSLWKVRKMGRKTEIDQHKQWELEKEDQKLCYELPTGEKDSVIDDGSDCCTQCLKCTKITLNKLTHNYYYYY